MPPPARHDPFSACNFLVEIDGIQSAGFLECSGLSSETDVIEYREGGDATVRKLPGLTKYGRIVLQGVRLRVLPLDRVIASKRATRRAKDIAQLPALEATLLARGEGPKP